MELNDVKVNSFNGLITTVADQKSLKPGTAVFGTKNWLTSQFRDSIELRLGTMRLGLTDAGTGKVTGLIVGVRPDGTEVPIFSTGRKIKYYNASTDDVAETGTDTLPEAADGEDIAFDQYSGPGGNFVFASSPNSSFYKIPVANPGSVIDQLMTTYRGLFRIKQGKTFLWNRKSLNGFKDYTSVLVMVDSNAIEADFTEITDENVGTGDGTTKVFTDTLAERTGKRTVFNILVAAPISVTNISAISTATSAVVTAAGHDLAVGDYVILHSVAGMTQINDKIAIVTAVSGNDVTIDINSSGFSAYSSGGTIGKCEYFTDDKNGILNSNLGGTGTINYATGAISVTFNTAPINANPLNAIYLWEDSTDDGILDITDTPTNFRQSDAGNMQNLFSIGADEYCMHSIKTYVLTMNATISNSTNLIYRSKVGIPYWRAAAETGEGIVYLDYTNPNSPAVRILQTSQFSTAIIPNDISEALELSTYGFDYPVIHDWGNYYILVCQNKTNAVNDTFNSVAFLYNKVSKLWDRCDFYASCLADYGGGLIAGDSISKNVNKIFSGYDDEVGVIDNAYITEQSNLGLSEGTQKFNLFNIDGFINPDQSFDIYASYDDSNFSLIGTVEGRGDYVDFTQGHIVGGSTVGDAVVGSGGQPNSFHFQYEFKVNSDRFHYIQLKFVAKGVGALQINGWTFKDRRYKGNRTLPNYQG